MNRLTVLLLHNNNITRIAQNIGETTPNLSSIMLTNNKITNYIEIENLSSVKKLETLCLLQNPVASKPQYRLYTIFCIPTLKCLDFRKVTRQEREEASRLFKSAAGKTFLAGISREKEGIANPKPTIASLTDEQKAIVKKAIELATTREEIDAIELQIKVSIPTDYRKLHTTTNHKLL